MKTRIALSSVMLFAFICLLPSFAAAVSAFSLHYSAGMDTYKGQKLVMVSKEYVSGKKIRTESEMGARQRVIIIMRYDKRVIWTVYPGKEMYMEQAIPNVKAEDSKGLQKAMGREVSRKYLGEDTVEGRPAKKYAITYKEPFMGKLITVYSWIDDALGLQIKMVNGDTTMITKNIKAGPQPDSLFEVPSGYKKMEIPSFGNPGMNRLKDMYQKKNESGGGAASENGQAVSNGASAGRDQAVSNGTEPEGNQKNQGEQKTVVPDTVKSLLKKFW